jgi:hypothetical protein
MKRKESTVLRIGAAALLCFVMVFSSCDTSGGADGKDGTNGADGLSLIWKGSLAAAPDSPATNWAYYNTGDGNSYIWDGDSWEILAKAGIPGSAGADGTPGAAGTGIVWQGSHAANPADPELNWAYYNTADGSCYIWNGTAWTVMVVGTMPTAATYNTTLSFDKAEDMASGFAALVAEYNPNDIINVTVTLTAGFDFSGLAKGDISATVGDATVTGDDPLNGLFTAIGSDNIYVHYDFSATTWTGTDGTDPVPFFLETTGSGSAYSVANLAAARPHRNQILSIIMPATLKGVGDYLFYDLQGLQKVSFAGCSVLETINPYAFAADSPNTTALTDITFTGCTALSYIGDYAFLYSANLKGSNGTTTLDLSAIDVPLLTIRDYAFFRAGVNGAMKSIKLPGGGYFGNNAFVRNMGVESVWITDGRWSELTWNNFLYLDKPAGYSAEPYGYSPLPPLWVRETADGNRGLGTGFVLNFFVPDDITLQRMAKGSDLLTNSEDDGNYFAGQLVPTKNGADAYRGQSSMTLTGKITDTITQGGTGTSTLTSTWPVYSKPDADSKYVVGAMVNGEIRLDAPAVANLEQLTPEKGMAITGDPKDYYLSASDAINQSGTKGQDNHPGDMWMVGAGPYASNTGYFWQPTISNNSGVPVTNAMALTVKDFYYPTTITQHNRYTYRVERIGPVEGFDAPGADNFEFDSDGDGTADAFKDDVMWSDWKTQWGNDVIIEAALFVVDDTDTVSVDSMLGKTLTEIQDLPNTMSESIHWYSDVIDLSTDGNWKPNSTGNDNFGYVKTKNGSELSYLNDEGVAQKTFNKATIVDADKDLITSNAAAVASGKTDNPQIYLSGEYYYYTLVKTEVVIDGASDWKKASRVGVDTYCIINHVVDNNYYTDQRKVYYVYVSQDVNLLRTAKSGNEIVLDHDKELGVVQTYYELIPDAVKSRYNLGAGAAAWTVNHHSVHLALKAGWNQVEEKTTYPGEISSPAEYRGIKTYRISTGKQGPFSTFASGNTTDFTAPSGKAYMLVNADGNAGTDDDIVNQYYSDKDHEIPVPWVSEVVIP